MDAYFNMDIEKISTAIDANKKKRPDYGQMLDLFGKIMAKQCEFSSKTRIEPVAIARDEAQAKLEIGEPVLNKSDFPVDVSSASELFGELCEILSSEDKELGSEIAEIQSSLKKRELALEEIFQDVLAGGSRLSELSEELSLDKDVMLTPVMASLKPSLEATAAHVADMLANILEDVSWSGPGCPLCGSSQAISELRKTKQNDSKDTAEGAERILHCSFCGSEWQVARLGCTFCHNTDAESLRYLYIEGDDGYRIDVCEKCKKYIKTVDSSAISHETVPAVEDIATLHLDIIAEEEGYEREAWFMPHYSI
jgi:FdhE protein